LRRSSRIAAVVAVALVAATVGWLAARLPGRAVAADMVGLFGAAFAALASRAAARRESGVPRRFWTLFAINFALIAAGRAAWDIEQIGLGHQEPNTPLIGLLFLGGIGVGLVALFLLPSAPTTAGQRLRLALDGLLVGGALLLVGWIRVFRLALQGEPTMRAFGLVFPFLDIMTFTVVVLIAANARTERGLFALVGAGLAVRAMGDTAYVALALRGDYHPGDLIDAFSPLYCVLCGLAALRVGGSRRDPGGRTPDSRPRALLPLAVVLLAGAAAGPPPADPPPLLIASFAGLVVLVLVRQALAVLDNSALTARLARLAYHDPLTGLPNRALFAERLEAALTAARQPGHVTVLMIDMDGFKQVNDSLGHAAGDRLLAAVAARLRTELGPAGLLARVGGDEFAALLPDSTGSADGVLVAERLLAALGEPVEFAGRAIRVGASLGVAAWIGPERDADNLIRDADVAMYAAKVAGRGRYRLFEPSMRLAAMARAELEADLRVALDRAEFELRYQPIVDLAGGGLLGLEALVRWRHPRRGLLLPREFVTVAEEIGVVGELDRWVLTEACTAAVRWQRLQPGVGVSVNFSAGQFVRTDLMATVTRALVTAGLPPASLTLELTETSLLDDAETTVSRLAALAALGVRVAIDDFGTGYSSLAYLRRLPVTAIKVDKMFVDEVASDPDAVALVRAILALASTFGLHTIAEGVETERQREVLAGLGCRAAQGYLFAEPLPAGAVDALLGAGAAARMAAVPATPSTAG
jgi:diguanylate cyclase (GGDEF)-like protein